MLAALLDAARDRCGTSKRATISATAPGKLVVWIKCTTWGVTLEVPLASGATKAELDAVRQQAIDDHSGGAFGMLGPRRSLRIPCDKVPSPSPGGPPKKMAKSPEPP
jgi:hypothetical protein